MCVGTCDNGDLTKMMASPKVDEQIKDIIGEFLDQRQAPEWLEYDTENEEEEPHSPPGSVEKEPTQPLKMPSAASCSPVTPC